MKKQTDNHTSKRKILYRDTWEVCRISAPTSEETPRWKKLEGTKDRQLLEKLIHRGRTNLLEWFEKITYEFYEEQAVEERTSVETVKKKFYTELTKKFFCSLPTLMFKFLIEKGIGHIVEPRPSLCRPPLNPNWVEKQKRWEKFITKREWENFISK